MVLVVDGIRRDESVLAVWLWWDGFKAHGTFRVPIAAHAAGAAPYHLMPFPPRNHNGHDYGHDGDDDPGDLSNR